MIWIFTTDYLSIVELTPLQTRITFSVTVKILTLPYNERKRETAFGLVQGMMHHLFFKFNDRFETGYKLRILATKNDDISFKF